MALGLVVAVETTMKKYLFTFLWGLFLGIVLGICLTILSLQCFDFGL